MSTRIVTILLMLLTVLSNLFPEITPFVEQWKATLSQNAAGMSLENWVIIIIGIGGLAVHIIKWFLKRKKANA